MTSTLLQILPQFDVVSFDVFDTLLLRPFTRPLDLFEKLERDFGSMGFAKARIRAEREAHRKARAAGRVEATFDEIYLELPRHAEMKEREIAAETSCWTANPELLSVWREAKTLGKKVVVASDMYLPKAVLERALRERGFDGWDGFFLSNDLQAQKASGAIYDRIIASFDVPTEKILHIGDNPASDIARANEKGIVAFACPKVFERFLDECPFVRVFLGKKPPLEKRLFVGALSVGWHCFKTEHPNWTYWNRIGYLFAGTLGYAYMKFVGERAKTLGIEHLLFVARDGYILQMIFDILHPEIKTHYFYASRVSALLATLDFGQLPKDIRQRREYLVDYLEKQDPSVFSEVEARRFLETGNLPPNAADALRAATERERKNTRDYFASFEIDRRCTALVDGTSSNFTVQNLLSSIYGIPFQSFYLHTMMPPKNADSFFPTTRWPIRFQRFSEILFGAPTPPLRSIENGKPLFESQLHFFERRKMELCPAIADGALAIAEVLRHAGASIGPFLWFDWFDAFADNRTREDEMQFSLVGNATGVTHCDYLPALPPPRYSRSFRIFGRTILSAEMKRTESGQRCVFKFFGMIPMPSVGWGRWCQFRSFVKSHIKTARHPV